MQYQGGLLGKAFKMCGSKGEKGCIMSLVLAQSFTASLPLKNVFGVLTHSYLTHWAAFLFFPQNEQLFIEV